MTKKELSRRDIIQANLEKRITQVKAAELLGITDRHFRRLAKAYKEEGPQSLISKLRGKPSNRRLTDKLKKKVMKLVRTRYEGFGPTLVSQKLLEEKDIKISHETIRTWMIEAGIWKPRAKRKARIHQTRNRRSKRGELEQVDGSTHCWFEDRGPKCTLLGFIDDATSAIMHLKFVKSESVESYFSAIKEYVEKHGRPQTFYTDRHSVFRVNHHKPGYRGSGITEVGRALNELEIELICANSPQAKGRVERMFGTLQDRLIKELRLRNISSIEEANEYLPEYIEKHNLQFSVPPAETEDGHRELLETQDLSKILCYKAERKLTKNLELSYGDRILQIKTDRPSYAMRNAKVEVVEQLSGEVLIYYKGHQLDFKTLWMKDKQGRVMSRKEVLSVGE